MQTFVRRWRPQKTVRPQNFYAGFDAEWAAGESALESPQKRVNTGMAGLYSWGFWFGEYEVRPENMHFQLSRRCWDYLGELWVYGMSSPAHWGNTCPLLAVFSPTVTWNLLPITHPHPRSPKNANKHNIPFSWAFPFSWDFILIK